jgi:hypothetical protein
VKLVFLLEEPSMRAFLEGLLPRILPAGVHSLLITHEGKRDLELSIPRKLRAWRDPTARFVVVRDQDRADCRDVKRRLAALCAEAGRPDALIRIACRELESWYLADLAAVDHAYGTQLTGLQNKRKYRTPDTVQTPSRELKALVPSFSKVSGARLLGPLVDTTNARSPSFQHLIAGVRRLTDSIARAP